MSEFEKTFNSLNAEQKRAVKATEGPVLVIAGPGTGKTQLLSARVAQILKATDTRPQNILCLTFTNKAAVNMQSRIIALVGPAGAKVTTGTFHNFAGEIMSLYPDYFWNAARLSAAPDSLQLDIIESIVAKLPLDNPLSLKFAGQYTLLKQITEAIKLTKEAGLTPDKLKALVNINLAYIDVIETELADITGQRLTPKSLPGLLAKVNSLPEQAIDETVYPLISLSSVIRESLTAAIAADEGSGKCANTSRWKSRWIKTVDGRKGLFGERDRNRWWLELAKVYEQYRSLLHERKFYDYADMLVEVITQLEQNPEILADIQERFSYVLLDEFQDSNPAQLRLAHLVADHHSAAGSPNLMAVGDDDQTIYKFNGAELNNMLGFKRAYPSAKIIVLSDSYRSTQSILDTAEKIITQAESRLVKTDPALKKKLRAAAKVRSGEIKVASYPSQELQLSLIARDIKKHYRPDYEIAVLARGHKSLIKMAGLLQQLQVPVRYEQAANILEHQLIKQSYLLAKLILAIQAGDIPATNALIHQIIRWPAWGLVPEELWRLAVAGSGQNWLETLRTSKKKGLRSIGQWFIELTAEAARQPLAVTIEQIIGLRPTGDFTSPVKDFFARQAKDRPGEYIHGLSAIQLLRALVHEFAAGQEPTVEDFVRFMEVNQENGIIVPDESPFITGKHAVQLLTVHKAKGLEFDHVYIINAIEDDWRPRAGGRRPPSNLPLQPAGDDMDDYIRLMYVAATRARSALTISAYHQDHSGRDVAISSIVQSALAVEKVSEADPAKLVTVLEENLRWPDLSGGQEKEMLAAKLEEYSLFATHLADFLDVSRGGPQYFKERHLLYLPQAKTASLSYGTAMHSALESAQKAINKGRFSLAAVKKEFQQALKEEQLPEAEYERRLAQGNATLTRLFKNFGYRLPKGSLSEQSLKGVMVGQARIGGTIDRTDEKPEGITIIDYKTGRPLSSFETKDKSQQIRAYKHKLQLIFYTLLLSEKRQIPAAAITGQMVYVEADSPSQLMKTYEPLPGDIEHLRRLVTAVWRKIQSLDLPDTEKYSKDLAGILAFEQNLIDGR